MRLLQVLSAFILLVERNVCTAASDSLQRGPSGVRQRSLQADDTIRCGCSSCTANVLATNATDGDGTFSCGDRIDWLMTNMSLTEEAACRRVAGEEFPDGICGPFCDPDSCSQPTTKCGCPSCTDNVLARNATDGDGTFSCGDRIDWVMANLSLTEEEACRRVAGEEFPGGICGPFCDPDSCQETTATPTLAPSSSPSRNPSREPSRNPSPEPSPTPSQEPTEIGPLTRCGCQTCTRDVLQTSISDGQRMFTCSSRIDWVMSFASVDEEDACRWVAGSEFPNNVCGPYCDPDVCDTYDSLAPSMSRTDQPSQTPSVSPSNEPTQIPPCGCPSCTPTILATNATDDVGTFTCGSRISWLINNTDLDDVSACRRVAGEEFSGGICGPFCDPDACDRPPRCGCATCNSTVLARKATDDEGTHTCGARIDWLIANQTMSEIEACRRVAGVEFPTDLCGPDCDPDRCGTTP